MAKAKDYIVIKDKWKRVWHLPISAVFHDWLKCEADYLGQSEEQVEERVKKGLCTYDLNVWLSEQMFMDALPVYATLAKDLTDKEKIALAESVMDPGANEQINDQCEYKAISKTALEAFHRQLKKGQQMTESELHSRITDILVADGFNNINVDTIKSCYEVLNHYKISRSIGHSGQWLAWCEYNLNDEKRFMAVDQDEILAGFKSIILMKENHA